VIALIIGLKWRDFCCTPLIRRRRKPAGCAAAAALRPAVHDRPDHRGDAAVGGDYSVDFAADCSRRDRAAAGEALYPRPAAGGSGCHRLLGGRVWLAFYLDSAPAPTIVVLFTALFVVAFVASTIRDSQKQKTSATIPGGG
jgi:hypothetical protein